MSLLVTVTLQSDKINAQKDGLKYKTIFSNENKYTVSFEAKLSGDSLLDNINGITYYNESLAVVRLEDNQLLHCPYSSFSNFRLIKNNEPITDGVKSVVGDLVDNTDPENPIINLPYDIDLNQIPQTLVLRDEDGNINVNEAQSDYNAVSLKQFVDALKLKVDKIEGKNLSSNDFTDEDVDKLSQSETHINRLDNPHSVDKNQIGLGNVDNTKDIDKPISNLMQSALDLKIDIPIENESVPIKNESGNVDSLPFAIQATPNTFSLRDGEGRVYTNTPTANNHTANKEYVDSLSSIIASKELTATEQSVVLTIPATAPDLLKFEIYIPDTIDNASIGIRVNSVDSDIYKTSIEQINGDGNYDRLVFNDLNTPNQGVLVTAFGDDATIINNIRITGEITNFTNAMKIFSGRSYLAGETLADASMVLKFDGSIHDAAITANKISQIQFLIDPSTAGFSPGSRIIIYGLK